MRPTTARTSPNALKSLIQNERRFEHPWDVLSDPSLTRAEKRAVLVSRVSNAAATPYNPVLRAPKGLTEPIGIDAVILPALRGMDGDPCDPPGGKPPRMRPTARPLAA